MLAIMDSERENTHPTPERADTPHAEALVPFERHTYAPAPENKVFGFIGTCLVFGVVAAGLFITFEHHFNPPPPSAPLVVNLLPLKSPPETPPKPKEAPKPVEKHERQPTPPKVEPVTHPIIPLPTISAPPPAPPVKAPDPAPPQPETAAPKTAPAPPAPQVSSNAPDTWEGRVLARLQKYQRYPGDARSARQQGVAYLRFRMNREGHVLSSSLAKSSGFPALDQAALDTLKRADPLPKIPPERPDEIELVVPVEYLMR
ncbi:energy transducer TonB family protein [Sphingobium yanoikuyae]|uniref:energy transducer TonB family protein n=1 Tax=Sphingobium yanoikuyae TaxID=13690 RepID=UPI0012D2F096|nr:energy transducer TonB [Sphingobium yanoikuyae]MDV3480099.1 energy transducer TonB [Sphingobium yanoikuyae]